LYSTELIFRSIFILVVSIASAKFQFWESFYLRQGYVIVVVCLSACLLATLRKNFWTDLHKICREVGNAPVNKWLSFGGNPGRWSVSQRW